MIKLEFLDSNDSDLIGEYDFLFDEVFIGRSKKADIIIHDRELPSKYLTIKFVQKKLTVSNEADSPFYFVNGKKLSGLRRLSIGDIIQFGPHKLTVLQAQMTAGNNEDDLGKYFKEFNSNHLDAKFVLDFLEEEIIRLENENNGDQNV